MAMRLLSSNIPLHCNICPEKPDFSDVSHLLTHIASKGHLSTYYKIKVKASSEDTSRRLIQEYDSWYAEWNIEDLMSERLSLKEKRKSKPRTGAQPTSVPVPQYHVTAAYPPFAAMASYDHAVDPRLMPHTADNKLPLYSRHAGSHLLNAPYMDPAVMRGMGYSYGRPAHPWGTTPYMVMPKMEPDEGDPSSEASFLPTANTSLVDIEVEENIEPTKLKGVLWPGMDMFDSAPPEQRRKRNQKKDTSVVLQLEAMSKGIEATELVFSPLGTLRKARAINSLPDSDDNPLPGEETPPRPKKIRRAPRRKPLAEKDPNTGQKLAAKPLKRGRPAKPAAAGKRKTEAPSEDATTLRTRAKKRGKAVTVYRDKEEASFSKPAELNTLTSSFQPSAQHHQLEAGVDAPGGRPMDSAYGGHQAYFPYHGYHLNQFSLEPAILPAWDYYSQDTSGHMVNPFFTGTDHDGLAVDDGDDDDQTISVAESDQ